MEIKNGYIKEEEMTSSIIDEDVSYVFNKEYKTAKKKQLVFNNELIGEVTKSGEYFISDNFLNTLVAVNKEIVDAGDYHYQAVAKSEKYPDFFLKFSILIEGDYLDDKKIASLTFLETIAEPVYDITKIVKTLIATYEDDNDAFFFSKVKSIFHLYEKDDGEGKNIANDLLIEQLILKRKTIRETKDYEKDRILNQSEKYCQDLMVLLKKSGKFGEFVLIKLQELLAEVGERAPKKGDEDYFIKLSLFLDRALQLSENYPIPKNIQIQIDNLQKNRAKEIDVTVLKKDLSVGKKAEVKTIPNEISKPPKSGAAKKGASKSSSSPSRENKAGSSPPKWYVPRSGSDRSQKDAYDLTKNALNAWRNLAVNKIKPKDQDELKKG